ncbi:MAG TPA: 3-phosphoglycerate dehydrogenase [Clostridiales bacterium]|nr:3-phosphoglycerate dehydrogenase [Clostridiales bacterium]
MKKFKVKLYNNISEVGLARLDPERFETGTAVAEPDAILLRSADITTSDFPDSLLCIGRAGIGVNNIPVDRCSEDGIVVFNTPGANANAVKELGLAALLLSSRHLVDAVNWASSLKDEGDAAPALIEKGKSRFVGQELKGKTLGIIGLGAIGAMLADIAVRLEMDVLGQDPYMTVQAAWRINRNVQRVADRSEIYTNCDYISLHVPLNDETKHMINAESLAKMKDGVRIINLSRAALVDDDAMADALKSGKVACYVTDFPNAKTLSMPNTICIPHLGASTPESEDNCAVMAADAISDYLCNGNIHNSVNLPDIHLPREAKYRLCAIHRNIPNMVGAISTALARTGLNIEHMINKSKKNYACTLVETNDDITKETLDSLRKVDGILRIRVIE